MSEPAAPERPPTPYPELNAVLDHLLRGARDVLGANFIGAYLQGSFAVGDFTPYSDCDFLIATRTDLSSDELDGLGDLHRAIHHRPELYWRTGLEGSYAPAPVLRRWSTTPRDAPDEPRSEDWTDPGTSGSPPLAYPFWYLDHGSDTLVRSEHDNTQVVRWCLRERGVVLAGPHPRELIDPVPPEALGGEIRRTMARCLAQGLQPMHLRAWQAFWVGLFCRMLHTLQTGEVTSKPAAMTWAAGLLDPSWTSLIERARALKKGDDAEAAQPTDPADAEATRAFARYVATFAQRRL